jgi:hypothetical protein
MLVHTEVSVGRHSTMFCLVKTFKFFFFIYAKTPYLVDYCEENGCGNDTENGHQANARELN